MKMGLMELVSEFVSSEMNVKKRVMLLKLRVDGELADAKLCIKCNVVKPLDQFHFEKNGVGGRKSKCNECRKQKS